MDINKFSFAQMTSNSDGKTSGSGSMGVLVVTVGTITFLLGAIDTAFLSKTTDIMTQSTVLVGIGVALLGYRKSKSDTIDKNTENVDNSDSNTSQLNS
jgi:hypothetical protein